MKNSTPPIYTEKVPTEFLTAPKKWEIESSSVSERVRPRMSSQSEQVRARFQIEKIRVIFTDK